jgi:SpoVK/Ycf46/Vps4 family AAA+-type ATPase
LKGLSVSAYRSCIPSVEEGNEINSSSFVNESRNNNSLTMKGLSVPQPPVRSNMTNNRLPPPVPDIPELTTSSIRKMRADEDVEESSENTPFKEGNLKPDGLRPELVQQLFAVADRNIAENILHDIVSTSLDITFDDIASLDDAKRVLYEAIVLPVMMPEFFTGIREPWKVSTCSRILLILPWTFLFVVLCFFFYVYPLSF